MVAVGEAAELQVLLTLKDQLSPGLATVNARVKELQGTGGLGGLSGVASKLESAFGKVGGALSHAASQIGGLVKNIGLFGGALALFSVAGSLKSAIDTASQMALAIEKLTGLTGESAQSMSALLAVFTKFGLTSDTLSQIVGFAEKTLGNLAKTANTSGAAMQKATDAVRVAQEKLNLTETKQADLASKKHVTDAQRVAAANAVTDATVKLREAEAKLVDVQQAGGIGASKLAVLDKQYGLSLIDAQGHVVDFTTELNQVADYWISSATAADKAHVAATLFGRGYAQLVPILALGSKGIKELEATAASLGLVLTEQNVVDLKHYQEGMRNLSESMGGLELQISLALLPALNDLTKNVTNFIGTNRTQIVDFFRNAAKFAEQMGHTIETTVVPAFKAIVGWWQALPGPLKDFLITAFVAGKVSKFLFNVNIPAEILKLGIRWAGDFLIGIGRDVLGMAAGGAVAGAEIEAAMAAGGATAAGEIAAAEAGGGGGILGGLKSIGIGGFAGLTAVALAPLLAIPITAALHQTTAQELANAAATNKGGGVPGNDITTRFYANQAKNNLYKGYGTPGFFGGAPLPPAVYPDLSNVGPNDASGAGSLDNVKRAATSLANALQMATTWAGHWTKTLADSEKIANRNFLHGKNIGSSADTITALFQSFSSRYFDPSHTGIGNLTKEIARFKSEAVAEAKHGNKTLADKLNADAAKLQAIKDKITAEGGAANSKLTTIANKPNIVNVATYVALTSRDIAQKYVRLTSYGRVVVT